MDVGQPGIAPDVLVRLPLVVQAELVRGRRVQVLKVDPTLHRNAVHILDLARCREFFATLPVGYDKVTGQEIETTPDHHHRVATELMFRQIVGLGSVRQGRLCLVDRGRVDPP